MRALSVVVVAAVMGSARSPSAAPVSAAGSGLTSLSVEVHEIPSPNTATAIDWQIDDAWLGGDIEVDLYSEALDDHVTVSWSVGTGRGSTNCRATCLAKASITRSPRASSMGGPSLMGFTRTHRCSTTCGSPTKSTHHRSRTHPKSR